MDRNKSTDIYKLMIIEKIMKCNDSFWLALIYQYINEHLED